MLDFVNAARKVVELPQAPEALPPVKLTNAQLADQIGELERRAKIWKPSTERLKDLKEELASRGKTPEESEFFEGEQYRVELKPAEQVTTLPAPSTMHRICRAVHTDFYALVTVTQKALKEHPAGERILALATRARTGSRSVTAVAKNPPAAA